MGLSKENIGDSQETNSTQITTAKKRRIRRKKLRAAKGLICVKDNSVCNNLDTSENTVIESVQNIVPRPLRSSVNNQNYQNIVEVSIKDIDFDNNTIIMSSKESDKSRYEVMAAREAKKLAKQKAKLKNNESNDNVPIKDNVQESTASELKKNTNKTNRPKTPAKNEPTKTREVKNSPNSKDEVDRAIVTNENSKIAADKSKELIKTERAAKKVAKQAKKKSDTVNKVEIDKDVSEKNIKPSEKLGEDLTVKDVVKTLKEIVTVAKDVQAVTDKVIAIDLGVKKTEESTKNKAELKAERRAKQEAQRAAKQASQHQKVQVKTEKPANEAEKPREKKSSKPRAVDKTKAKSQTMKKMNWFQHLHSDHDKESLKQMEINSNLHPAVIKLGVQLASHVVTGSNARCIALLDALKKMVRDYSLPARTEFARGLEAQLAASIEFLWAVRPPAASQTNALKYFRHHLTQLPNNVDEFDAKKRLQEEIDRYIREQIDMAGEAISIAVRNKISDNDNILTYGCSSLIERILCEAAAAGKAFRALVLGARLQRAHEMLRRLTARGVRCSYADISALNYLMPHVNKVVVGAASLLANGAVLAPAGTLGVALAARAHNVPLLVACETHKFADTSLTDSFVYNEIGNPDELIDKSDENSPLKDWRSNPNLSLLNLTYDVTPSSLVTAVVTELAILPCTSAPVVLRFKLSEYGL